MSALAEFERLMTLGERVRPADRVEYWRRLDKAARAAMAEARALGESNRVAEIYNAWIQAGPRGRPRGNDRLKHLPPRVAAALAEATYAAIEEKIRCELKCDPTSR